MSFSRALTVGEMLARDLLRRRVALVMLLGLPLAFYFASSGGDAISSGGIGMSWAIAGASLFAALASRAADPRLVLDGYRPAELLIGRLMVLWVFGAIVAAGFGALMLVFSSPSRTLDLFLALALVALVAVPLGLAVAAIVPRELEGTLLIIGLIGIPMSLSPRESAVGWLPFGGAQRLLERASGQDYSRNQALLRGVGWAVLLSVVAVEVFRRRVAVRRAAGDRQWPQTAVALTAVVAGVGLMVVPARSSVGLSREVVAAVAVGRDPLRLTSEGGSVWTANFTDRSLSRVDEATNRVVATVGLGGRPLGIAASGGAVWVTEPDIGVVERVDTATNRVVARIGVGGEPVDVAVVGGAPWVVDHRGNAVVRIDPVAHSVVERVPVGRAPVFTADAAGTLWVGSALDRSITRVDPKTGRVVATIPVPVGVTAGAGDAEGVWLLGGASVLRLDGTFASITFRTVFGSGSPTAVGDGGPQSVWVALRVHVLVGITLAGSSSTVIRLGGATPGALLRDGSSLWVTDVSGGRLLRVVVRA